MHEHVMYTHIRHFHQKKAFLALSVLILVKGPRLFQIFETGNGVHMPKACLACSQKFGTAVGCWPKIEKTVFYKGDFLEQKLHLNSTYFVCVD